MKTSEIAGYISTRNPRLAIGGIRAMLPLVPPTQRRALDVGWVAFNLIAILETERADDLQNERDPEDQVHLMHNPKLGAFGFMRERDCLGGDWEVVEWDGFGGLETWKEAGI